MIIVSITGPTIKEALKQIADSSRHADLFEFRFDLINEPFMSRLFAATRKPVVATCRSKTEGGGFTGSEAERMDVLEAAVALGAAYVDVELSSGKKFLEEVRTKLGKARLILSYHQFDAHKINVRNLYRRMRAFNADVVKVAYLAEDAEDIRFAIEFLNLARNDRQHAVAIAMGEYGEASRVLYRRFGGWGMFASADDKNSAAPGQVTARTLKELYRADRISSRTKIFGVIGNPLIQSKSIYLHNPLFHRAKKDAVYCRFQVRNIAPFMKHIAPMLNGFSVTLPHKESVMKHLDQVGATGKSIGAVNTVIRRGGKLVGVNTDASAALDPIEQAATVKGKRLLIVGAGGAARAIAFEADRRGARVFITNRTAAKAKSLARDLHLTFLNRSDIHKHDFDIIVNSTSVGMVPRVNESPLPKSMLKKKIVFDAVYSPPMTKLLKDAKDVGAKVIKGTDMYMNQAALQFELYAGEKPSIPVMKKILGM